MRRVISRHPALSTVFIDAKTETKKPYYARLPQVDLRDCILFAARETPIEALSTDQDAELDHLLERHHNTRFDERWEELPLWRLIIVPTPVDSRSLFVACFVYQHTIGDGNAGPSFHRTLQEELCALSAEEQTKEPDPIVRSPDAVLPPSLESLHKLPLSPAYLLKMAWYDKFPSDSPSLWLGAPVTHPTRSRFLSSSFPQVTTDALLAVCRDHSVTMTAVVHTLISTAIFGNLPPEKTQLKSSIAIDLRRFLPAGALGQDEMGNYVSATYIDHKRPSTTSDIDWAEARRIKAILDDQVRLRGKNTSTGCLRWVGSMHRYFKAKFGQPRDASFCLTNLGNLEPRRGDVPGPGWPSGRMVFSEAFDAAREAMDVTMVTGADGCLTLGLVWGDGVVEETLILGIFKTLRSLIVATAISCNAPIGRTQAGQRIGTQLVKM